MPQLSCMYSPLPEGLMLMQMQPRSLDPTPQTHTQIHTHCTPIPASQLFDYDEASYDGPLDFVHGDGSASERLVVVANRLPVTCSKDALGHWQLQVRHRRPGRVLRCDH